MSSVLDQMLSDTGQTREDFDRAKANGLSFVRSSVPMSAELRRILALPRRSWEEDAPRYVEALSHHLRAPGGTQVLRPVQAAALVEMHDYGGLLGIIRVGGGKTALSLLGFLVLEAKRPLLIVPAKLVDKTRRDMSVLRKHWIIPHVPVKSYEILGREQSAKILDEIRPDVIICDEVHKLRNTGAAVTRRVKRYLDAHPETKFVGLSGTMMKRSLHDYYHLAAWALKHSNPTPTDFNDRMAWAMVIDEKKNKGQEAMEAKMAPGALIEFCNAEERELYKTDPIKAVRSGYRRRLVSTPGVVATQEGALAMTLSIDSVIVDMPEIRDAVYMLKKEWKRPDGEPVMDAIEIWRHLREVATGFYYRWNPMPPREWLDARRAWARAVREVLRNTRLGLDSEGQIRRAVLEEQRKFLSGEIPARQRRFEQEHITLEAWQTIEPTFTPKVEAVWISRKMIDFATKWMAEEKGIVWVEHTEFGRVLSETSGVAYYQKKGQNALGQFLEDHPVGTPLIASIASNAEGRNLQAWSSNLITSPPTSGALWEQCLDADTQILTSSGWKGIDDNWDSASAAAFNPADGTVAWQPAVRIERQLGDEKMYGIQNPHLDIRVTAGHRMLVRRVRRFGPSGVDGFEWTGLTFLPASDLPRRIRMPICGAQHADGVPLTSDELVLVGLYMTDGYCGGANNSLQLFQSDRYPYVVALIERTLRACGLRYGHSQVATATNYGERRYPLNKWNISKGLPRRLSERATGLRGWAHLEPYLDKNLSTALDNMSADQLRDLLVGMWAGDGNKNTTTGKTITICSARELCVDRLQSLCVRRGLRCNKKTRGDGMHMLYVSEDREWTLTQARDGRPTWAEVPSRPEERVWCVSVPFGAIITRRNGKVAVVGNCLGRTHRDGQEADEVTATLPISIAEQVAAFERARADAQVITETTGQEQKLTYANISVIPSSEAPTGM